MAELGRLRFMRGLADNFDVILAEEEVAHSAAQVAAYEAQQAVLVTRLLLATGTFPLFDKEDATREMPAGRGKKNDD